jgi:hypothetical protein
MLFSLTQAHADSTQHAPAGPPGAHCHPLESFMCPSRTRAQRYVPRFAYLVTKCRYSGGEAEDAVVDERGISLYSSLNLIRALASSVPSTVEQFG